MRNLRPVDIRGELQNLPDLTQELWYLIDQIPTGYVSTYGQLAEALGDSIATRWVGHVLLHHDHLGSCPCHRVVRATGEIGNFITGDASEKALRLQAEKVRMQGSRVDLQPHRFDGLRSHQPLAHLRQVQISMLTQQTLADRDCVTSVAGVDISYAGDLGFASYVEVDPQTGQIAWFHTTSETIQFPYISSYLAFRELPLLMKLLDEVRPSRRLADVLMVDGSGIAHPRRAGIATMLGIAMDVPTIGISKKVLFGSVDRKHMRFSMERPIWDGQTPLGTATLPWSKTTKPIYISPGHRVSVEHAMAIVRPWLGLHRLPDPIYWADHLSREAAGRLETTP